MFYVAKSKNDADNITNGLSGAPALDSEGKVIGVVDGASYEDLNINGNIKNVKTGSAIEIYMLQEFLLKSGIPFTVSKQSSKETSFNSKKIEDFANDFIVQLDCLMKR